MKTILLISLSIFILISCNFKAKESDKNCIYSGMTWNDLSDGQKNEILNAKNVDKNVISVFNGKSAIVAGTKDKKELIRKLGSPNCTELPLFAHVIDLILGDSIYIYSDKTKTTHYTSTDELGYAVIKLFQDHPKEMYRYATHSSDTNYNYSGALVAGFYGKAIKLSNDLPIPNVTIEDFFKTLKENIVFENEEIRGGFTYFQIDIEAEVWGMLEEQ